jgi:hypothetical protein
LKQPERADANDFLILKHAETGFLVDRGSIFASIYLEKSTPINPIVSGMPIPEYMNKTMEYSGETIVVFDLDSYLGMLFGARNTGTMKIALIAAMTSFTPEHGEIFRGLVRRLDENASDSHIAFKIGSQAEIKRIGMGDLHLLPRCVRPRMAKEGILGCRFPERGGADFLIDLEALLFNSLARIAQ